jgi:hypothetical protein
LKDKLVIIEDHHGNLGATLGEDCTRSQDPLLLIWAQALDKGEVGEDDLEHRAATVGAASQKRTQMYPTGTSAYGFYWEQRSDAQQALTLAKLRIKEAKDKKPWPQWAREAVAHGWKAPKGWTP